MVNNTSSITCGNCKRTHGTVAEVKECYRTSHPAAAARADAGLPSPSRFKVTVPESMYALDNLPGHANALTFFSVKNGKKDSKWEGFQFLSRLVGHPGSFQEFPVKGDARKIIMSAIARDPKAAAVRFSTEFTICAACGSPLTDDDSRARGLGPVCAAKF